MPPKDYYEIRELHIYDASGQTELATVSNIESVDVYMYTEDKYNQLTGLTSKIWQYEKMEFTMKDKVNILQILGVDMSKAPDMYGISFATNIPARCHKKKRINKKWLKRYGYKLATGISCGWRVRQNIDGSFEFIKGEDNYVY